jgi:hypothetical protein
MITVSAVEDEQASAQAPPRPFMGAGEYMTVAQVAAEYPGGRSEKRVYDWLMEDRLPYVLTADLLPGIQIKQKYLIKRADFETFIANRNPPFRPQKQAGETGETSETGAGQ